MTMPQRRMFSSGLLIKTMASCFIFSAWHAKWNSTVIIYCFRFLSSWIVAIKNISLKRKAGKSLRLCSLMMIGRFFICYLFSTGHSKWRNKLQAMINWLLAFCHVKCSRSGLSSCDTCGGWKDDLTFVGDQTQLRPRQVMFGSKII